MRNKFKIRGISQPIVIWIIAGQKKTKNLHFSPTKFEKLSALLLNCFDYNNYFITKKTDDQGIDLIAYSDHFKTFFNINSSYRHYIFRQCKKYTKNYVDTNDIQKLWGSMEMFRSRTFAVKDPSKI